MRNLHLKLQNLPLVQPASGVNSPLNHPFAQRLLARGVTAAVVTQLMRHARRTSR